MAPFREATSMRYLAGGLALFLIFFALKMPRSPVAQTCTDCIPATISGINAAGSKKVCFNGSFNTEEESAINDGITYVNGLMVGRTNTPEYNVAAPGDLSNCNIYVEFDHGLTGTSTAGRALVSSSGNGYVLFNPAKMVEGANYIAYTSGHEFLHMAGFDDYPEGDPRRANCDGLSMMAGVYPGHPGLPGSTLCADEVPLSSKYPIRRDNDSDGFSPDDEPGSAWWDCDDSDPGIGSNCETECGGETCTPILVPLSERGIRLSGLDDGVLFDIAAKGSRMLVSWPSDADSAWLGLDRNGNGIIDDGSELFGNNTRLRSGAFARHGFELLAELDDNWDGVIDARDEAFESLRLWRDITRDGACVPEELATLESAGILSVGLEARESRRVDRWGNEFRYRSHVAAFTAPVRRYAYDVIIRVSRP